MLAAVVKNARALRAAVQETVVVLDCLHVEAGVAEDLVGESDLGHVVVRDADVLDPAALQQRDQEWRPAGHVGRIVDPVQIHIVRSHSVEALVQHVSEWPMPYTTAVSHRVNPFDCAFSTTSRNPDAVSWLPK
nr:hypothetical protein [Sciscionella sp. SE31]